MSINYLNASIIIYQTYLPGDIASKFPLFKFSTQDLTVPGETFSACAIICSNKQQNVSLSDYL
jgi:hypothetical protein